METVTNKKILVPYDFSEEYVHALKFAERIATSSGATITLLHTVNPAVVAGPFPNAFVSDIGAGINQLPESRKLLCSIAAASELPAERFEIKSLIGPVHQSILSLNEATPHDLIVVPEFKHSFLDQLSSDIDALWLIEKTKVPVITVNGPVDSTNIHTILLPVREVGDWFFKVPFTVALARLTNAKIVVVGLVRDKSRHPITEIWKKLLRCKNYLEANYSNFEIAKTQICSDLPQAALEAARHYSADLISVTPPEKSSAFSFNSNKHFYNRLISNGGIPVLGV